MSLSVGIINNIFPFIFCYFFLLSGLVEYKQTVAISTKNNTKKAAKNQTQYKQSQRKQQHPIEENKYCQKKTNVKVTDNH